MSATQLYGQGAFRPLLFLSMILRQSSLRNRKIDGLTISLTCVLQQWLGQVLDFLLHRAGCASHWENAVGANMFICIITDSQTNQRKFYKGQLIFLLWRFVDVVARFWKRKVVMHQTQNESPVSSIIAWWELDPTTGSTPQTVRLRWKQNMSELLWDVFNSHLRNHLYLDASRLACDQRNKGIGLADLHRI